MKPLSLTRRSAVIAFFAIMTGVTTGFAEAPEKSRGVRVGPIEMVGVLSYGTVGIGGAATGIAVTIGGQSLPVRVADKKLLLSLEALDQQRVWIEGVLNYEEWYDEASSSKKLVLVLNASHIRPPRPQETETTNEVVIEGRVDGSRIRFGKHEGAEWLLKGATDELAVKVASLERGTQRLEGRLKYHADEKRWVCEVTRILPLKKAE